MASKSQLFVAAGCTMIYGDPCLSQKFLRLLWGTHVPCQFIIICVLLMFFSKENEGIARINLPSKIFKFGAICSHVALALGITAQMFHQIRFERNRVKPDPCGEDFLTENIVSEMELHTVPRHARFAKSITKSFPHFSFAPVGTALSKYLN